MTSLGTNTNEKVRLKEQWKRTTRTLTNIFFKLMIRCRLVSYFAHVNEHLFSQIIHITYYTSVEVIIESSVCSVAGCGRMDITQLVK